MSKQNKLLIFILTTGVFGILNTEMGVIGLLPAMAENFQVSVAQAGLLVSLFAIAVAISGPILPLVFSGINHKKVMLIVFGVFVIGNIITLLSTSFGLTLTVRVIQGLFHPVYFSIAISVVAASVSKEDAPKAVSKVFIGVSAGMVAGVPIANFINSAVSYDMALAFFAIVNAIVLIATIFFVPSMPVKEKQSYGEQLSVLKKPDIWLAIVAVILFNSAVFGVYSYLAEYLETVTDMSANNVSLTLFIFGGANILGNLLAGWSLTKSPSKSVIFFPLLLAIVYIVLFFTGEFTIPMLFLTLFWGILAGGLMANVNQYLITSSAPEAPFFANGLFTSACNVGTTVGSAVGGLFITQMGTQYVVLVGILSLVIGIAAVLFRNYSYRSKKQAIA